MKKLVIATSIAMCLSFGINTTSLAKDSTKEEKLTQNTKHELIGFGSGAASGAIVAGPLGAIVGGVIGVLIAEDVHNDKQLKLSDKQLQLTRNQLVVEKQQSKALENELLAMQRQQMIQLASIDEQANDAWLDELTSFETKLQFKTASFSIEDIYKEQLNGLASLLVMYPQLKINITGYADSRGDADYNQSLSMQRAQAVENYLLDKNVDKNQLLVKGAGELQVSPNKNDLSVTVPTSVGSLDSQSTATSKPKVTTLEDLFFARKVNIKFAKSNTNMTAAK